MDARTDFQCTQTVSIFLKMDNVFDRRYATSGFLGDDSFRPDGSFRADGSVTHEDEVSPGAPRTVWLGVEMRWH
jgi:outer membrane receptor protein involved in Fe transport